VNQVDEFLKRTWAQVDLDAIAHNYSVIKKIAKNKKILAVVKADAYGHGAVAVSKKLQDLFVDKKVPKDRRGLVPIITDEERIIWAAGVSLAQEAAVTAETERVINLKVEPL
jgi:tRNA(Ile)-lysidine synthetase-like protein